MVIQEIADALSSLKLGAPQVHANLALFPLLGSHDRAPDYLLLDEALERKLARVTEVSQSGLRHSNQGEIWSDIADKNVLFQSASDTGAMGDIYESRGRELKAYATAFRPQLRQRGAVVAIDGKVAGLELFDSAATFAKYLAKLVDSYALDAIETTSGKPLCPPESAAREFIESLKKAAAEPFAALGEGEDIRLAGKGVAGGALAANGRIVHLCAAAPSHAPAP